MIENLRQEWQDTKAQYIAYHDNYSDDQLRVMNDDEFAAWKAEAVWLWLIAIDAQRAYFLAVDADA